MSDLRVFLPVALALCSMGGLSARDYFVSPSGSDTAPGTLAQPFQTIQRAAALATAGDTMLLRAGVYRETVAPRNSGTRGAPIVFRPYNAETVVVSGADVVPAASWNLSGDSVYRAPLAWDLGDDANQVFVDGEMMVEARWPNTTLDLSHPVNAHARRGTFAAGAGGLASGIIEDSNLPAKPAGYWSGATLHICMGPCWTWQAGTVLDSAAQQLTFRFTRQSDPLVPGPNDAYFLTGKLSELDAPGEWFREAGGNLHLRMPASDSPSRHAIEVKRRRFAFNLSGRSFITVQNLGLFAAGIVTDARSEYVLLDGLDARYLSHDPLPPGLPSYEEGVIGGVVLMGQNNVLRHSSLAFSSGSGVYAAGAGHRVLNNRIADTDYRATYASPIYAEGAQSDPSRQLIAYNTISNSARFGIYHPLNFAGGRIVHNEIYDFGLQTNDLGCIYTWNADGKGTEIAYNLCHDGHGLLLPGETQVYVAGIYLDNGSRNFVVHHNVVWNTEWGLHLNDPSSNQKVYNNTFAGTGSSFLPYGNSRLTGSEIKNNIFVSPIRVNPIGGVLTNNILPGTDAQFADPARGNYQLKPTSPAIAAGAILPPYTDGFSGPAPDIGAYDHSRTPWRAGVQPAAYTVSAASYGPALAPGSAGVIFGTAKFDSRASVTVTDGLGVDFAARVLYSTPAQLAFEVPPAAAPGVAMIAITNPDRTVSLSSAPVFAVAPGLISADASGSGVAAAGVQRVRADGSQVFTTADAGPIDLGVATDRVFVILYGTGIRGRVSLAGVTVTLGGVTVPVSYAGAQGQFPGLDQVNVAVPSSLAGRGNIDIILTVDGQTANTVTMAVK